MIDLMLLISILFFLVALTLSISKKIVSGNCFIHSYKFTGKRSYRVYGNRFSETLYEYKCGKCGDIISDSEEPPD